MIFHFKDPQTEGNQIEKFEMDDDFEDFGSVHMYNKETQQFIDVNTMNKEEVDKWIELI